MRKINFSKGFTLVELLVVIAVIGILSTVVLLQLGSARAKARDIHLLTGIKQMETALYLYYDNNGSFPSGWFVANCTYPWSSAGNAVFLSALSPYVNVNNLPVPACDQPTRSVSYIEASALGNADHCTAGMAYRITTQLEVFVPSPLKNIYYYCDGSQYGSSGSNLTWIELIQEK